MAKVSKRKVKDESEVAAVEAAAFAPPADDSKTSPTAQTEKEYLEGFDKPIPLIAWSTSKADYAGECMFKYDLTYNKGIRQTSKALTLGNDVHDIIAKELIAKRSDKMQLLAALDAKDRDPELYSMVPSILDFTKKWYKYVGEHNIEYSVENKYAITRDGTATKFLAKDVFIRCVIDLWAYDEAKKNIIVIDHKSSKSKLNSAGVKAHNQLNLYVWMLAALYNLDWETANIALHYTRFNSIVWALLKREDVENFKIRYFKYLEELEYKIRECELTGHWPKEHGHYCRWCSFREQCSN